MIRLQGGKRRAAARGGKQGAVQRGHRALLFVLVDLGDGELVAVVHGKPWHLANHRQRPEQALPPQQAHMEAQYASLCRCAPAGS
ncbi:hypothetical protein, partial [Cupriavidus basilensis]|uniref:hypothetical protein n=1 Tax=Cupriavidus basilensis TaxID=68895 RepID=UPI001C2D6581